MNKIKKTIFLSLMLLSVKLYAQSNKVIDKIADSIVASYKQDSAIYKHVVDTVMKLRNGNYFVLVRNLATGQNLRSSTYDYYEVNSTLETERSILNLGDKTDHSEFCNLTHKVYYLNNENYIVVALKKIVSQGTYSFMTIVLNSSVKYFDAMITQDYVGEISKPVLDSLIKVRNLKNNLRELIFKTQTVGLRRGAEGYKLTEKNYQVLASDFNFELNCIMRIKMIGQKITVIKDN